MDRLWTMTVTELRQRVRDRSVFVFGLIVPIAMMLVFDLTFGSVSDVELDPIEVAWSAPEGDSLAAVLVAAAQHGAGLDLTVRSLSADEVRRATEDGEVPLGVVIPAGFTTAVTSGQPAVVEVIEGDEAGIETDIVIAVIESVLNDFGDRAVTTVAGLGLGLSPEEATRVAERAAADAGIAVVEGETASEQLGSSDALVAGQAGMFLLFTVGFGVLGLVTEREQGTLARLRSMPMPGWLIVASKGLTGFILGVVATAVLLAAGSILFDVDFGHPAVVAVLILCAVAAGTSLTFIVARLARTAEQSNMMQSILAIVLGIAGGAFFPTTPSGLLADVLDLNPIAAFSRGLGISAGGGGFGDIGTPVAIMVGFAGVCLAASLVIPDRGGAA